MSMEDFLKKIKVKDHDHALCLPDVTEKDVKAKNKKSKKTKRHETEKDSKTDDDLIIL